MWPKTGFISCKLKKDITITCTHKKTWTLWEWSLDTCRTDLSFRVYSLHKHETHKEIW